MARVSYDWREGFHPPVRDPQRVGEALAAHQEQYGRIEVHKLVEDARDPKHPLHDAFEWDDSEAAAKYRLSQAGYLVRSIKIKKVDGADVPPVRAFVSVKRELDTDTTFVSTAKALDNPYLREQVVRRAVAELESWRHRYAELEEFAELHGLIVHVTDRLRNGEQAA